MQAKILIIADSFDSHADVVQNLLGGQGKDVVRINLDKEALLRTKLFLNDRSMTVQTPKSTFTDRQVGAIWARKAFLEWTLEEREQEDLATRIWRAEWNRSLLGLYHALAEHPWFQPIHLSVRAENKYLQWSIARDIGMRLPRSLTSNDKQSLIKFCDACGGQVAFKMMHQDIYRQDGRVVGLFTNKISHQDLLEFADEGENPITIQEYIEKSYEVRYTVVGSKHFVCKIDSQACDRTQVDWRRYDIPRTPHLAIEPPNEVQEQVNQLISSLGLRYGALDFIVTPQNDWYFLEVNSMGQWLWIEDLAGLPISSAIAELLIELNSSWTVEEKTHEGVCYPVPGTDEAAW